MKTVLFLAVFGCGLWCIYQWLQRPAVQAVMKAPQTYAKSLAEDEKRAAEVAAKANAAVSRTQQAVERVVEEGERK